MWQAFRALGGQCTRAARDISWYLSKHMGLVVLHVSSSFALKKFPPFYVIIDWWSANFLALYPRYAKCFWMEKASLDKVGEGADSIRMVALMVLDRINFSNEFLNILRSQQAVILFCPIKDAICARSKRTQQTRLSFQCCESI